MRNLFSSISLIFFCLITMGQNTLMGDMSPRASKRHCKYSNDDIWNFAKPNKKRHAVITILAMNINDTLSIKVGNKTLMDCHVYNNDDKHQIGDINGEMCESFFLVYYPNDQIKYIYNTRNCSEYCIFERKRSKNKNIEVEITYNGKKHVFHLQPTAKWHHFFLVRDSDKVVYNAHKYFTGLM